LWRTDFGLLLQRTPRSPYRITGHQTLGPLFADAEKNATIMVSRTCQASNYYYTVGSSYLACLQGPSETNKQINYRTKPNAHSYSLLLLTAVGNRRFRILIDLNMQKYKDAKSKIGKSLIVMSIVDTVREASVIGGFVKKVRLFYSRCFLRPFAMALSLPFTHYCTAHTFSFAYLLYWLTLQDSSSQRWHEVPDAIAREKVGQQIRETLAKINPMKCEARKVQRKSKAKRPRQTSARSTSIISSSSAVSMSSSATSLSSAGEELNCSGTTDWGNNDAIDTDDTTFPASRFQHVEFKLSYFDSHFASSITVVAKRIQQPHRLRAKW
jgi:hypothetical protein